MIASCSDGTGIEYIEKLAEYGYDYAELPLAEITALSEKKFIDLKKRVEESGIKVSASKDDVWHQKAFVC